MKEFLPLIIRDLFAQYVGTMRVGKYELWTWKGTQKDILKIQLATTFMGDGNTFTGT